MEVKTMNPNPKRSRMNEKEMINNPFTPMTPFYPFVRGISSGQRAMMEALPYGKNTLNQELVNSRNQQMAMGTRNQQMFGETLYSSSIPGLQRV